MKIAHIRFKDNRTKEIKCTTSFLVDGYIKLCTMGCEKMEVVAYINKDEVAIIEFVEDE